MKKLHLVWRIIKKQKMLNIILCLELAFTLILLSFLVNRLDYNYRIIQIMDQADMKSSINYVGRLPQIHTEDSGEVQVLNNDREYHELENYLKSVPEFIGISEITNEVVMNVKEDQDYYFITYDAITAHKVKSNLKEGVWYTDAAVEEGVIPVVVVDTSKHANSYHIGERFSGNLANEKDGSLAVSNHKEHTYEVVGIINKENAYVFQPSGCRNYVGTYETFFEDIFEDTPFFLAQQFEDSKTERDSSNSIIYLKDGISNQRLSEIKDSILQYGYCDTIPEMRAETIKLLNTKIKLDFPNFFSLLCISMIGMISIAMLNTKKQRKEFAIYRLCGSSLRNTFLVYLLYQGIMLIASFSIYFMVMKYCYWTDERGLSYLYTLSPKSIIVSSTICVVVCMISSCVPYKITKKASIIRGYHLK